MPNLYVLLSTFNGEAYLEDLLQSVLQQTHRHFQLRIRDDGSTDRTLDIVREYAARDERVTVEHGTNIGVQASFHRLLENVEDTTGFYAFCDQDDIWAAQKLEMAMKSITNSPRPDRTLYFSRLSCVDDKDRFLYNTVFPRAPGITNALVENSAIGCTCLFGYNLRSEFLRADPAHMIMHDWWLYLCAASTGDLIYDEVPRIRYRQHENTATPREPGMSRLKNRFVGLLGRIRAQESGLESLAQANHFLATYPDCDTETRANLQVLNASHGVASILKRASFVLTTGLHRNNRLETFALKLVILFDLH